MTSMPRLGSDMPHFFSSRTTVSFCTGTAYPFPTLVARSLRSGPRARGDSQLVRFATLRGLLLPPGPLSFIAEGVAGLPARHPEPRQGGRSDGPGVVAEDGRHDWRDRATAAKTPVQLQAGRLEQEPPCRGPAAADDDHAGIEGVHEGCQTGPQPPARALEHLGGELVPGVSCLGDQRSRDPAGFVARQLPEDRV